jgi:hypothetical protein
MQELELFTENRQDYITEPSGKSHVTESSNGKWQHPLRQIHGRGNVPVARNPIPKPHKTPKSIHPQNHSITQPNFPLTAL